MRLEPQMSSDTNLCNSEIILLGAQVPKTSPHPKHTHTPLLRIFNTDLLQKLPAMLEQEQKMAIFFKILEVPKYVGLRVLSPVLRRSMFYFFISLNISLQTATYWLLFAFLENSYNPFRPFVFLNKI